MVTNTSANNMSPNRGNAPLPRYARHAWMSNLRLDRSSAPRDWRQQPSYWPCLENDTSHLRRAKIEAILPLKIGGFAAAPYDTGDCAPKRMGGGSPAAGHWIVDNS